MSRIGRLPIPVPLGVTVAIAPGNQVTLRGPKGELHKTFAVELAISQSNGTLVVQRPNDQQRLRSLHGLTRSLLANMVEGVSKGFEKALEIVGVGYRAQVAGNKLVLQVGLSHPVEVVPPPGIALHVEGQRIVVSGIDKELVGEVAAQIRRIRPPEPYKGKGLRYRGEGVRQKAGKAGRGAAAGAKKR